MTYFNVEGNVIMKSIIKENIPNEIYQTIVILYGGGIASKRIIKLLKPYWINIEYIVDDDMNKWGTQIEDIEVISYERLKEICRNSDNISVILTTIYGKTILEKLNQISNIKVYEMYGWLDEEFDLHCIAGGVNDKDEEMKFCQEINLLKDKPP